MLIKDSLIGATPAAHGLAVVTRNRADFAHPGVRIVDPFPARRRTSLLLILPLRTRLRRSILPPGYIRYLTLPLLHATKPVDKWGILTKSQSYLRSQTFQVLTDFLPSPTCQFLTHCGDSFALARRTIWNAV